jgi:hypothetical protein
LIALSPALLAPLLSNVTFSGNPLDLIAFIKKALAAVSLRFFDNIKSIVSPSLSTAR